MSLMKTKAMMKHWKKDDNKTPTIKEYNKSHLIYNSIHSLYQSKYSFFINFYDLEKINRLDPQKEHIKTKK